MLYEKMNPGENLSWCRPYVSKDENCFVVVCNGKISGCIINNENVGYILPSTDVAAIAHRLAVAVNPDYAEYNGYSDLEIALDAMTEIGCADCPFRDDCDAMWEDEEEE